MLPLKTTARTNQNSKYCNTDHLRIRSREGFGACWTFILLCFVFHWRAKPRKGKAGRGNNRTVSALLSQWIRLWYDEGQDWVVKGQDLWCTIRGRKASVSLFCFVLFSVTQGLAIFVRGQDKQVLAPPRPLNNARPSGWSVFAVPPAVVQHSSLHPSGKLSSGSGVDWPWAEGEGSMWSQDKWALVLWRVLGSHLHKWWRQGRRHQQQACAPDVARRRTLCWHLWATVLFAYISAIFETENPEFVALTGPHSCTPQAPAMPTCSVYSLHFLVPLPGVPLPHPFWAWSNPIHPSTSGKGVTTSVEPSLTLSGTTDRSFLWSLKALGAQGHHNPYMMCDIVLKLSKLLFSCSCALYIYFSSPFSTSASLFLSCP